jgi:hypothetical protein
MDQPPIILFRRRFWLWLAVWCVAFISAATALPRASRLGYTLLFPYGLITFVISALGIKSQNAPHVIFGWLLYLSLTIAGLITGKRLTCCHLWHALRVADPERHRLPHVFHGYQKVEDDSSNCIIGFCRNAAAGRSGFATAIPTCRQSSLS